MTEDHKGRRREDHLSDQDRFARGDGATDNYTHDVQSGSRSIYNFQDPAARVQALAHKTRPAQFHRLKEGHGSLKYAAIILVPGILLLSLVIIGKFL